jgi:hypothetical protein
LKKNVYSKTNIFIHKSRKPLFFKLDRLYGPSVRNLSMHEEEKHKLFFSITFSFDVPLQQTRACDPIKEFAQLLPALSWSTPTTSPGLPVLVFIAFTHIQTLSNKMDHTFLSLCSVFQQFFRKQNSSKKY